MLHLFLFMFRGKHKTFILYCNTGKTSGEILKRFEFHQCRVPGSFCNMAGGIEAWKEAGYPVNKL